MALFWVPAGRAERSLDVQLQPLAPLPTPAPVAVRAKPADGRTRVIALWPDCGSWFIANLYAHQGVLPNFTRMLGAGSRLEMISTTPPFTSTAYLRMVEMKPGMQDSSQRSAWEILLLQLKGLPILDGLIPYSEVAAESRERRTIFSVLAERGFDAINLVFGDKYISAANDLAAPDGKQLEHEEDEAGVDGVSFSEEELLSHVLRIDPAREPERARRLLEDDFFLRCAGNSQEKVDYGLKTWAELDPDFMLLRLPAIDWMSHRRFSTIEESPALNVMQETYRHLDHLLGQVGAVLDADDTLILGADHGIYGTLHHHASCVLVVEGPGISAGAEFGTIPIGWFPCVVLSRFGIDEGSDRLNEEIADFLYARTRAAGNAAHGQAPALITR
jgi:hypothetical protein